MSNPRKLGAKILSYFTVMVTNCSANNNIKSMKMKENIGTKFKNNFILGISKATSATKQRLKTGMVSHIVLK